MLNRYSLLLIGSLFTFTLSESLVITLINDTPYSVSIHKIENPSPLFPIVTKGTALELAFGYDNGKLCDGKFYFKIEGDSTEYHVTIEDAGGHYHLKLASIVAIAQKRSIAFAVECDSETRHPFETTYFARLKPFKVDMKIMGRGRVSFP